MCSLLGNLTASELSSVGSCIAAFLSSIATAGLLYMAYMTHNYVKKEDEIKYARYTAIWIIGQDFDNGHFVETAIINLSECPIYDVYVVGCQYDKTSFQNRKPYGAYLSRDVIPPNTNDFNKSYAKVEVIGNTKDLPSVTVSIFFRDINGIEWCRDSHGNLCKCPGYVKYFKK
ncbi:hypothetical protein [Selenomonas bovis]|uniref:hypothetical protein n=1 Tax=Selenomonas bovis TaxID=416586 RepID=UPI0018CC2FB0|nr:hypothetical protein [Selenomonas bovis]